MQIFVVPGNRQALLGMPDIDILNIININIHSIGTEHSGGNDPCCTNNAQEHRAQCRKQKGLRNAIQTQTVFQILTIQISQWSIINQLIQYDSFLLDPSCDSDKKMSAEITWQLQRDFEDVFNGIGCFDGTFSLQVKLDSKPYQAPQRCVAYVLQKPFEEELKWLQEQDITTPLGVDETAEWCNSFVLVPKAFGGAPAGDIFQRKIDKIFKELPNVFSIANDILVVGYGADDKDHEETLQRVLQICTQVNLKLNKDKCHFRCTSVPFFGEIILQHGVKPDPRKLKALMEMPPPKNKKELQLFLGKFLILLLMCVNH